ncbi:MAG: NAD-dependent epimerase/dehydratase family protein [Planctomycetaceae bacterium]
MQFRQIVVTGGAGFVGSNFAVSLKQQFPEIEVTAVDNLKRRGGELTLTRLREHGVRFHHADVRCPEDLDELCSGDLLVDCSAEPSVHAGAGGSPQGVLNTNLAGTLNCLEWARRREAAVLFLSTSRVYPIDVLNALPHRETGMRQVWVAPTDDESRELPPAAEWLEGITEKFPLAGRRSMYGASKLCCELIAREYAANYRMPVLVNRCGVLTGPWQMSRIDQGVVALWVARHHYGLPLRYIGFGGRGTQVRDVLHVDDLFELFVLQAAKLDAWTGEPFNVGGGWEMSVSLRELTELCRAATGRTIEIEEVCATSPVDVRIYVTNSRRARDAFHWRPTRPPERIVNEIHSWIRGREAILRPVLC